MGEPVGYLVARILQALAEDERTNILDLQVNIAGGKAFLMCEVDSGERRTAVELVVREIVPADMNVINELWIREYNLPPTSESLP